MRTRRTIKALLFCLAACGCTSSQVQNTQPLRQLAPSQVTAVFTNLAPQHDVTVQRVDILGADSVQAIATAPDIENTWTLHQAVNSNLTGTAWECFLLQVHFKESGKFAFELRKTK